MSIQSEHIVSDEVLNYPSLFDPRKPYAMRLEKIGNAYYCPICHSFKPLPFSIRFCDWCGQRFEIEPCPKVF